MQYRQLRVAPQRLSGLTFVLIHSRHRSDQNLSFGVVLEVPLQRTRTAFTSTRVVSCLRHRAVDAFFKETMKKTAEHPHCLTAGTAPGLMDNFKRNNEILEGIAKGLDTFLEVGSAFRTRLNCAEGVCMKISESYCRNHLPVRRPEFLQH